MEGHRALLPVPVPQPRAFAPVDDEQGRALCSVGASSSGRLPDSAPPPASHGVCASPARERHGGGGGARGGEGEAEDARSCCFGPSPTTPSECGGGGDDDEDEADAADRKVEALEELKGVVGALQGAGGGACMSRVEAAAAVRRKAKDAAAAREMLAMLGAVPPLVAMLDEGGGGGEEVTDAVLYALLNLGIGNDTNKAAIVQAGAVHKMLRIAEGGASAALTEAVVANFLCLSVLDANKPVIGASGAAPFLVRAFQGACDTEQARHDALRALLNLSIAPANAPHLLAAGLAPTLVASVGDAPVTDRALIALYNLVAACPEGRRAPDAMPFLVDVLNWADEPGCQEKAAYVLMVLAHRSYGDRAAMAMAAGDEAKAVEAYQCAWVGNTDGLARWPLKLLRRCKPAPLHSSDRAGRQQGAAGRLCRARSAACASGCSAVRPAAAAAVGCVCTVQRLGYRAGSVNSRA
ncbi:U-box domain-containing protein 45-like [Panicum virgatum]|uniref:U-box domain-containing protein 45-like n=1 Tax=Panicum virgatum TaxID=38727 RepID=UPI0019D5CB81|nr:U-box domain-containing protein 45-like [Panicum virgatum]